MPPLENLQLRQTINNHIAQVWECLQITQDNSALEDEETAQKNKRNAQEWLVAFKHSLPPEGHQYMMQLVYRIMEEQRAGRYPLSFLESEEMQQQGRGW